MGIGGDQIWDADATRLERVDEGSPMGFRFGDRRRNAECHALAVGTPDSNRTEDGAVPHRTVETDLDVGGI